MTTADGNRDIGAVRLRDLRVGDRARVVRFAAMSIAYRHRLMSLGIIPGTEFSVSQVAPLGDPMEIRLRGFQLSLRRLEAGDMEVERL